MYQYVRSKDELLLLIFDDCLDKLAAGLEEAAAAPGTAAERLRRAVDALVQGSELHREQIRLITREAAFLPPPTRSKVHRRWAAYLGHLGEIISDGIKRGEFASVDPELTAHLIESLCKSWSLRRFVMRRHGLAKVAALIQQLSPPACNPPRRQSRVHESPRPLRPRRHGLPELERGFPDPAPGEGDAVIAVRATSLNYHDIFTRRGMPGIRIAMPAIWASTSPARSLRSARASRAGGPGTACWWIRSTGSRAV